MNHVLVYYTELKRQMTREQYEAHKRAVVAWQRTTQGRVNHAKAMKKYNKSQKGKVAHLKSLQKYYQKQRLALIQMLGGKCANPNCRVQNGMDDVRALQFDHIEGGGTAEKKKMGPGW